MNAWPLPEHTDLRLPRLPEAGAFGAVRKHDIHTGVDLYCEEGATVVAIEEGVVVAVVDFTGPRAGSPWWNDTKAVLVYNAIYDRTIVYGEIEPKRGLAGSVVLAGDWLGTVKTVLKEDKGLPMSMLHLELYDKVPAEPIWWHLNTPRPDGLQDPTPLLASLRG